MCCICWAAFCIPQGQRGPLFSSVDFGHPKATGHARLGPRGSGDLAWVQGLTVGTKISRWLWCPHVPPGGCSDVARGPITRWQQRSTLQWGWGGRCARGCSSRAARARLLQPWPACSPLPGTCSLGEGGMKPPRRHPSAQDVTHGLQGQAPSALPGCSWCRRHHPFPPPRLGDL